MLINNNILVEMFGNDKNKERFYKTKKVDNALKKTLLSRANEEFLIAEDLGRGKYKLENKIDIEIPIPNKKMTHPIYGNLIPAILLNVKEYHDSNRVFCLSLNSIYSNFQMINKNYIKANSRKVTTSNILNILEEVCFEFFETTHSQLKYYLNNSLNLLSAIGLIKYKMIPYVSIVNKEIDINVTKGINDKIKIKRRRSTKEEEQYEANIYNDICDKYDIKNKRQRLFGEPLIEYKNKLHLKNIEYFYECYEIICLEKSKIEEVINFYNMNNKEILSDNFTNNFIGIVMSNAENRHKKAIEENLIDFYRFNKQYLEDFLTLSNNTLDYKRDEINIPQYKISHEEDEYGGIHIIGEQTK